MKRNPNLSQLKSNYLFPEVNSRKQEFLAKNPKAALISLGVGDTTQPIPGAIVQALMKASYNLGTLKGYSGYGPEQGMQMLRKKISEKIFFNRIEPDEVFISDGANCDLGRLQMLFGSDISIAVQDPAYPVYFEGSVIQGVKEIVPMPCNPENHFFPDLGCLKRTDLIYFCSPNNPTGAVATKDQLKHLIDFAIQNRSIIIFDAAYSSYIQDPLLPKSIYEIENAEKVAIEINSFSKFAGFTGVRLGWTVIPKALKYEDGTSVNTDWNRLITTIFNGASNIAQSGGYAVLEEENMLEIRKIINFYLENAAILKNALQSIGKEVFGGVNAPYLWVRFKGQESWDTFQYFLEEKHIVTIPGSGFGSQGNEFIRLTAFGNREEIHEAISRIFQKS